MKVDASGSPAKVFVASQEWNAANRCYTVRVSVAVLDVAAPAPHKPADAWTRFFETSPCLPVSTPGIQYLESGGRLGFLGDKILLTVGDFGLGNVATPAPSQSADNPFGKVLLLDRSGSFEIFTMGHRNPQGLLVDADQRIWLTEHGPQSGDELNLLQRGHNYGWPLATYGTEYGRYYWPIAPGAHDHGEFTEPIQAFVPAVGISISSVSNRTRSSSGSTTC